MPLSSKISDFLDWWPTAADDARSMLTVGHLVNFTSGFGIQGTITECNFDPMADWENCSKEIIEDFIPSYVGLANYNEAHIHISQTIALKVTGTYPDWNRLWWDLVGYNAGMPYDTYFSF